MGKIAWYLILFWPLVVLWSAAFIAYFVFSEHAASIISLAFIVSGAATTHFWTRFLDRSGGSERLLKWLDLNPKHFR